MKAADNDMNCENIKGQLTDWLNHNLTTSDRSEVEKHLIHCLHCQEEFAASRQVWEAMGQIKVPEPSREMRVQFHAMLDTFKASEKARRHSSLENLLGKIKGFVLPQWSIQLAFSLLLVGLGWVIGSKTSRPKIEVNTYEQQIDMLAGQVQEMKSTMMLSLIENPSATERLRAVGYTSEITNADERVIEALFATLNNDPNVNVRLVTLEALTQFTKNPAVREGLVKSLAIQDSPMVQVALADVMVKMQEKGSVKALQSLLRKEDLNDLVKNKIEQSIKDLS
jgi:hypothetical protein